MSVRTTMWSIRPCIICGKGVKCEPGYPQAIKVVCPTCINAAAANPPATAPTTA